MHLFSFISGYAGLSSYALHACIVRVYPDRIYESVLVFNTFTVCLQNILLTLRLWLFVSHLKWPSYIITVIIMLYIFVVKPKQCEFLLEKHFAWYCAQNIHIIYCRDVCMLAFYACSVSALEKNDKNSKKGYGGLVANNRFILHQLQSCIIRSILHPCVNMPRFDN